MVNPHISLNPWIPPIHGAILGFSEDFYCEIHGFCGQSSDLAVDLSYLNPQVDLRSSSTLSGCQFHSWDSDCLLHNLCCLSHWQTEICRWCFWELDLSEHRSEHRSVCVGSISFNFWSIHPISSWNPHVWGAILRFLSKSLVNPQIAQIS